MIYFFILTWYKHISDSIVLFHCISMKNIFLREVACFVGLASDDSNMSTWSSHPCFTTRVIYEHETGGCEVMFAMVYIIAKYHPLWKNIVKTTLRRCFDISPEYRPLVTRSSMRNCERESNWARKNFARARKILKLRAWWARAARGLISSPAQCCSLQ